MAYCHTSTGQQELTIANSCCAGKEREWGSSRLCLTYPRLPDPKITENGNFILLVAYIHLTSLFIAP